jgi:hypothetical protein
MTQLSGGNFNPLIRATKNINIYKKYQSNLLQEGENSEINPNVMKSSGHSDITGDNTIPCPLGRTPADVHTYGIMPEPEFQSGVIFIDPNLRLLKALHQERELLSYAGLDIDPDDDIKLVKDDNGQLKAALAINYSHMGQIIKIKYIDVDDESKHFHGCMCKLLNIGSPVKYYEGIEVIKNELSKDLIKE